MSLPFELLDGHVLFTLDGHQALLDTGAPESFGRVHRVELPWAGPVAFSSADSAGRRVEEVWAALRDHAGPAARKRGLDLLVGCNLLSGMRLTLDWAALRLSVEPWPAGTVVRHRAGLPTCEALIGGERTDAVLDTGARLSYVRESLAAGAPRVGTARDFNLLTGRRQDCEVSLASCAVGLAGATFRAGLGIAAGAVEQALQSAGLGAIVGTDLMALQGTTTIDLPDWLHVR